MALSATVTKKVVMYVQPKLHNITFTLSLNNGSGEVLNRDVTIQFREGESPGQKVAQVTELLQAEIDHYKSEQVIFTSALLNNAVSAIQAGLVL